MEACKEKLERDKRRGIKNRPIRAMIAGIPNVGKSTFINSLVGKACTKTGNKPGVTKGKQWIKLNKNIELLDTPGILWPKFEDETVGMHLALIGSVNDEILISEELAVSLITILKEHYLTQIAKVRNCVKKGAELDIVKAADVLLDDYRSGKLGRITLEYCE